VPQRRALQRRRYGRHSSGYTDCYNVLEGFEGEMNNESHRNTIGGMAGGRAPWKQG